MKLSAQVCKHTPWFHHNPRSQPLVVSPTRAHVRCGWRTGTAPSRYSRCLRCPPAGGSDLPRPSLALLVEVSIWSKKSEIRRLNMTQKNHGLYIYAYINIYQHLGEIETLPLNCRLLEDAFHFRCEGPQQMTLRCLKAFSIPTWTITSHWKNTWNHMKSRSVAPPNHWQISAALIRDQLGLDRLP